MGFPGGDISGIYIPPPPGEIELNLGDQWRARWVDEHTLPAGTVADYAWVMVCEGDRGYLTREAGSERWGTVEGRPGPGEKPLAFVKRAAKEQTGAIPGTVALIGYLECRATSHNPEHPAGTVRTRPIFLLAAKQVRDLGKGSPYERRRLPLNQHMAALRPRYPELEAHFGKAATAYAVLRAKAEA